MDLKHTTSKESIRSSFKDYLTCVCEGQEAGVTPMAECLSRAGASLLESEREFVSLVDKLHIGSAQEAEQVFPRVIGEMYSDGKDNWGRVVTVAVFSGVLVRQLRRKGIREAKPGEIIEAVSEAAAEYMWTHKAAWIRENGGWENGLMEYLQCNDTQYSYKKFFAITGIVAALSFGIYHY